MDWILVKYRVACGADEVEQQARDIALEQTVEVPESLITDPRIQAEVVGQVRDIAETGPGVYQVQMAYNADLACSQIPQLLNLLYGNVSIKKNVRIDGIDLPDSLLKAFPGPNHGIDGLRRMLGVYGRPLLATALKPRGASTEHLAGIARGFALAGGDCIKDDHNLVDQNFDAFRARVGAIQAAVDQSNAATGRNTVYFPSLYAPAEDMDQYVAFLVERGVRGVMTSPWVTGLDTQRRVAKQSGLVIMAHPTFSGAFYRSPDHGIAPPVLLGDLMRLAGADISIFPNYGGRFSLTREECMGIAQALRQPLGALRNAFPAPAGGMQLDRVASMSAEYGEETVFLIGGALLAHADDVRKGTEAFLAKIREYFPERLETPAPGFQSACEMPASAQHAIRERLPFDPDAFRWLGRDAGVYKAQSDLPFAGVSRHELVGATGEDTAFELRYFELAPGGYTSHEKHAHTHTVVAVRGTGVLARHGGEETLRPFDIAYVAPMQVHQLRNPGTEPFGFFCIVNRDRDRPMAP